MKNLKKFNLKSSIFGFIVGSILFSIIPVFASIEQYILYKPDYKVYINNKEYNDKDYPILAYKGKTYAPIRFMTNSFGLNIDMSLNKISISKPTNVWTKVDDYNTKFNNLPFIKSTSEGNIFSIQSSDHIYNFKYENNIWYVMIVE